MTKRRQFISVTPGSCLRVYTTIMIILADPGSIKYARGLPE